MYQILNNVIIGFNLLLTRDFYCFGSHSIKINRERIYVYIWLILNVVQQKLTEYCKAITFQYKNHQSITYATLIVVGV